MNSIIIGFSSPVNVKFPIYANIIKLIYKTKFSHVYIKLQCEEFDRILIYESVGTGTRFINKINWEKHAEVIEEYSIDMCDEQFTLVNQACIDNLGTGYSILQAIGIGIEKLVHKYLKIRIKNPFKDSRKEICSQAAGDILNILGYNVGDTEEVTPFDLNQHVKRIGTRIE